jgi:membrane-associated phospholipid phosphatase
MQWTHLKSLRHRPRLIPADLWLCLLPALIWVGGIQARSYVMNLQCVESPHLCSPEQVFFLDRLSLGHENATADLISTWSQDLSGTLAFGIPVVWGSWLAFAGHLTPATALAVIGTDLIIIAESVFWTGAIKELTHWVSQRPRPFVYADPKKYGTDPAHYTSFYSGHTSFAMAAGTALILILIGRSAATTTVVGATSLFGLLSLTTAFCRVLAGRHFITDVLVALVAGGIIALLVALLHRARHQAC